MAAVLTGGSLQVAVWQGGAASRSRHGSFPRVCTSARPCLLCGCGAYLACVYVCVCVRVRVCVCACVRPGCRVLQQYICSHPDDRYHRCFWHPACDVYVACLGAVDLWPGLTPIVCPWQMTSLATCACSFPCGVGNPSCTSCAPSTMRLLLHCLCGVSQGTSTGVLRCETKSCTSAGAARLVRRPCACGTVSLNVDAASDLPRPTPPCRWWSPYIRPRRGPTTAAPTAAASQRLS